LAGVTTLKFERSNVEFPLWRKKVDKSLFEQKGTTVPAWACDMWDLPSYFRESTSKRKKDAEVTIIYEGEKYRGWVTAAHKGRKNPAYRLWYDDELSLSLKRSFLMSYMRALEQGLSKTKNIEDEIPFWEFLDIEFDKSERVFKFVAYYKQEPSFPHLFDKLIGSPPLRKIGDELEGKEHIGIYKQDWKPREQLEYEIGAYNVIYILADTENQLLYVGEALDLVKRLNSSHSSIPNWNYFRYNVLPDHLSSNRVMLERMVIRDVATLLSNNKCIDTINISGYRLANEKIDK
jgi:hypothetical protein